MHRNILNSFERFNENQKVIVLEASQMEAKDFFPLYTHSKIRLFIIIFNKNYLHIFFLLFVYLQTYF